MSDAGPKNPARAYAWALGLTLLLPAVLVGIGWVLLPHEVTSGQCEGIGFGCVPAPADSLLIVAMIVGLPVCFAAAALSCLTIAIVQAARRRRGQTHAATASAPRV